MNDKDRGISSSLASKFFLVPLAIRAHTFFEEAPMNIVYVAQQSIGRSIVARPTPRAAGLLPGLRKSVPLSASLSLDDRR